MLVIEQTLCYTKFRIDSLAKRIVDGRYRGQGTNACTFPYELYFGYIIARIYLGQC
jgi:hypothetical protein